MRILIKPIISEKATLGSELRNEFSFLVDPRVNKLEIKKAVEKIYDVKVDKVSTMNYGPKRKIRYTKTGSQKGKTNARKKAVVHLAEGSSIDFYSKL